MYKELFEISVSYNDMINSKNVVNNYIDSIHGNFVTLGKPKAGEKRITIEEFANKYNEGTYILYLRDYYVAIIDGVLYNTININSEAVYSYWKLS